MAGIAPDARANEIRVPWDSCKDSDLSLLSTRLWHSGALTYGYQENDLEGIKLGEKRAVQQRKQHGRWYSVRDMASRV
jgi:hypothetical protein